MVDLKSIQQKILAFRNARNWGNSTIPKTSQKPYPSKQLIAGKLPLIGYQEIPNHTTEELTKYKKRRTCRHLDRQCHFGFMN
jgi:hypothetical protein